MEFLIGALFIPLVLFLFNYEKKVNDSRPKIVLETIYNHALSIRNTGKSEACAITETTSYFRDVPETLRGFEGDINYYTNRDRGIYRQIGFIDLSKFPANKSMIVRFQYKNPDGHKFYSEIEIKRNSDSSPPWFFNPRPVKSGRTWF